MKAISGVVVILVFLCLRTEANKRTNMWWEAGRMTGLLLHKCMQLGSNGPERQLLLQCLKRQMLLALDRSLDNDVITLADNIDLVRYQTDNRTQLNRSFHKPAPDEEEPDWKTQVLQRFAHVLHTHVLKIRLSSPSPTPDNNEESRGHRKRQSMMLSVMLFGMVTIGMVMIPMGFQFLAVLGGKALLLAKLALILTAIQGLKKIATSNMNYGLYTTLPEQQHCELEPYDVFVSMDVDDLSFSPWPYDRQYNPEGSASASSYNYQLPEISTDLLHPRVDCNNK